MPFFFVSAAASKIGPGLHFGDLGINDPQAAAAEAQHRVEFVERFDAGFDLLVGDAHLGGQRPLVLFRVGQELVERRIDRPDGHRPAVHDLEDAGEIVALERQELGQGGLALLERVGQDHLPHRADLALAEEHVLGPAEADALGAEGHGVGRDWSGWSALVRIFRVRYLSAHAMTLANVW